MAPGLGPQDWVSENRLILKPRGNVLGRDEIHDQKKQQTEYRGSPIVAAQIAGLARQSGRVQVVGLAFVIPLIASATERLRRGCWPERLGGSSRRNTRPQSIQVLPVID